MQSDIEKALKALEEAEIALSFALAAGDHIQCRVDIKKAQESHKAVRKALQTGQESQ